MSYILDALQRSDSERAVGNIQTLDSPGHRPPPRRRPRRRGWFGWLIFLLLIAALLFALYFFRGPVVSRIESHGVNVPSLFKSSIPGLDIGHGFAQARTTSKVKTPAQRKLSPVAVQTPAPDNPAAVKRTPAQRVAPQTATPQPARVASPVPEQPPRQPAQRVTQAPDQVTAGLAPARQPVPTAAPAPSIQVSSASPQPVSPQPTSSQPEGGNGVSAVPQGSQRPQTTNSNEVESSDDLPSSMRQQLPQMALNVVSYSLNDDKRFVMIDQKIYREGESVQGGMKIEQITEDGPIMSWRGRRFLMRP